MRALMLLLLLCMLAGILSPLYVQGGSAQIRPGQHLQTSLDGIERE